MKNKISCFRISTEMLNKGYSINKLAKESKISKSTLSRILNNTSHPRPETIYKIASTLNMEIEEITNYDGDK